MANGYAIKRGSYCWFYRCMASISYPIRALRSLRGPMMMLLMGFYFLKVPFDMLCGALRELLMMTPSKELCQVVGNDVLEIEKVSDHQLKLAGITKVGQELRVNIDLHVDDDMIELDTLEQTRKQLTTRLSKHRFKLQLNLNVANC